MSLADKIALDFQRILDERLAAEAARKTSHQELRRALGVDHLDDMSIDQNVSLTTFAGDDEATIRSTRSTKAPESLLDMAHPKPVFVAESDEEGGLVENLNEAHEKMMDAVNKIPSGFMYHGIFASVIHKLTKLAQDLDDRGFHEVAIEIDEYCTDLRRQANAAETVADAVTDEGVKEMIEGEVVSDLAGAAATGGGAGAAAKKVKNVGDAAKAAPKSGLIGRALSGLARLLGAGAVAAEGASIAGVGGAAPVAAGILAAVVAAGAIYKIYTGSLQEGLDEDVRDLLEEIQDARDLELSPRSNEFLNKMQEHANALAALKSRADSTKEDADFIQIIAEMHEQVSGLKAAFKMFVAQASGEDLSIVRQTLGLGFPSLENVIEDIESSVAQFVNAITEYYHLASKAPAPGASAKEEGEAYTEFSPQLTMPPEGMNAAPAAPAIPEPERIAGIQRFMREKVDPSLVVTGKMDQHTIAAIERFTGQISRDLGVTNLTSSRVMESGTEKALRRTWDIYENADRILATETRK